MDHRAIDTETELMMNREDKALSLKLLAMVVALALLWVAVEAKGQTPRF